MKFVVAVHRCGRISRSSAQWRPLIGIAALAAFLVVAVACADDGAEFRSPLGFELNVATLADVRAALGDAEEFYIPDSHHEYGICYQADDSDRIVVFQSARESGGAEQRLLAVSIFDQNRRSLPCSPSSLEPSQLDIGALRLGMTEERFRSLGDTEPVRTDQGRLSLGFEERRELTQNEREMFPQENNGVQIRADVFTAIWCLPGEGGASEIGVWQTVTY